jgi:hypothetical protein
MGLDGQWHVPTTLYPGKETFLEAARGVVAALDGYGKSRVQTPHLPTRSNLLYPMSYPGRCCAGVRCAQEAYAVYIRMVTFLPKSANYNRFAK